MHLCMCACVHVCMDVCMHVCMHARMYACMYACMHACMHVCKCACMHAACMHACMQVCMFTCMHVCMYACMHVCMCAHIRVCVCACMHVCMYEPGRLHQGYADPIIQGSLQPEEFTWERTHKYTHSHKLLPCSSKRLYQDNLHTRALQQHKSCMIFKIVDEIAAIIRI